MRVYHNNIQQAQLWPVLIGNTSSTGILQTAMRHVAHNLGNMTRRSIEIDNLRIETVPINRLKACSDNPEAEAVGIYLLINGDLSGEAILILCPDHAMNLADSLLEARPGATARLNELECSALSEFGNLALSSFLNAFQFLDILKVDDILRLKKPLLHLGY